MKTTINGIELEGTPKEFKEFLGQTKSEEPDIEITPTQIPQIQERKKSTSSNVGRKKHMNKWERVAKHYGKGGSFSKSFTTVFKRNPLGAEYRTFAKLFGPLSKNSKRVPISLKKQRCPNRNTGWTQDSKKELVEMVKQGYTKSKMAKYFGRTSNSIRSQVSRLKNNPSQMDTPVKTPLKRWTLTEDEVVMKERRNGNTPQKIANLLPGRTFNAIVNRINVLKKKYVTTSQNNIKVGQDTSMPRKFKYTG